MSPCLHETFVYNKIIRKKVIQKINGVKIDEDCRSNGRVLTLMLALAFFNFIFLGIEYSLII